jgi:hypothetical protein
MTPEQLARHALEQVWLLIDQTYGRDQDTGERLDNEPGDLSAADVVERLCNLEICVGEALDALQGEPV